MMAQTNQKEHQGETATKCTNDWNKWWNTFSTICKEYKRFGVEQEVWSTCKLCD